MNRTIFVVLLACAAGGSLAQSAAPAPAARAPEHDALQHYVGTWTVTGSEDSYVETCAWYDGRFQVVCQSERQREDGSTGRGMSVLGYAPGRGYLYAGIGNGGRFEILQGGTYAEGRFQFLDRTEDAGKSVVTRISIGPFDAQGMDFVVDTSTDGGPWTRAETIRYLRRSGAKPAQP